MIRDIVRAVEIFTKVSDPPEMLEKIMYRVIYRDGALSDSRQLRNTTTPTRGRTRHFRHDATARS